MIQEQQRVAVGPGNAHSFLFARCRPTHPRFGAAAAAAAAAADAAVYSQFTDQKLITIN